MASEHPALKSFSPTWEGIKHVAGKALKWAAWGAAIAAVFIAAPALGIGALSKAATWVVSKLGGGAVGATVTEVMTWGLAKGAVAGAVLGGLAGVGGVAKAIEERKEDHIADYERAVVHEERSELIKRQRVAYNGQGGSVSPNVSFGQGQDRGVVRS